MQHFDSDYMEGAHPLILERLTQTNSEKTPGYGADSYCSEARAKIREACQAPQAEIFFMVGGTQTNATVIDALLRPWQGVLAADTGHISIHEAGAIEASGHKVLALPQRDGKLEADTVEQHIKMFYADANHEHMVAPGMVYISHPTEYGTLYTKQELERLHALCSRYNLPLFLDGARLGYGLAAAGTDVTLPIIASCCDVFYIGGTKVGALFGEAVVFSTPHLSTHFFSVAKRHGAVLAKGRLLGIQFDTLFTDDLYLRIAAHAVAMAAKLRVALAEKGYRFYIDSPTNQLFVVMENHRLALLAQKVGYSFWEALDDQHTVIRLAMSWATSECDVDELIELL